MIHRFRVRNFKSIHDADVVFSPVTVLIGKSGTGKSNFVESLRFLRDFLVGSTQPGAQFHNALAADWHRLAPATRENVKIVFDVEFSLTGMDERFNYYVSLSKYARNQTPLPPIEERLDLGGQTLFHQKAEVDGSNQYRNSKWITPPNVIHPPKAGAAVLGQVTSIFEIGIAYTALTAGIGVYLFADTALCMTRDERIRQKKNKDVDVSIGLDDNAENYLNVLKEIVSNLQRLDIRKEMIGTIRRLNPLVASVELNNIQNPDHIVVGHKFNKKTLALPLSQESCGFRRFYAHLLALYQQPSKQTLVFEHPEDGIHPGALALLADEFNAAPADNRGQILLTTHSPQFLDHFSEEQIRVVELEGFETRIGRLSGAQREALCEDLLGAGELLTVDPARLEESEPESTEA